MIRDVPDWLGDHFRPFPFDLVSVYREPKCLPNLQQLGRFWAKDFLLAKLDECASQNDGFARDGAHGRELNLLTRELSAHEVFEWFQHDSSKGLGRHAPSIAEV